MNIKLSTTNIPKTPQQHVSPIMAKTNPLTSPQVVAQEELTVPLHQSEIKPTLTTNALISEDKPMDYQHIQKQPEVMGLSYKPTDHKYIETQQPQQQEAQQKRSFGSEFKLMKLEQNVRSLSQDHTLLKEQIKQLQAYNIQLQNDVESKKKTNMFILGAAVLVMMIMLVKK